MIRDALFAAAAAGLGVLGAWDLLAAAQGSGGSLLRRLAGPLARAGDGGEEPTRGERRRVALLLAGVLLAGGWLVAGPALGALLAAAGPLAGRLVVERRRRAWRAALLAGAPTVARAIADALAGGHSVRGALGEAASRGGLAGPVGGELRRAAHALELGVPTDEVLERLRRRASAPAYDTLAAAVLLQRDAGGDLARLLRDLAASLEAAVRLERDARAATAQARFTGGLVAALPLGAAGLAELAQPGLLLSLLRFAPSAALLVVAALLQATGVFAVRRLSRSGP